MNKEFVPYEESLALKELGFDEPCLSWFSDRSIRIVGVNGCALSSLPVNSNFNGDDEFVTAPLYQQAFRWFREKHNLCGEVYTVNMGAIDYTFQIRDLYSEDVKHNNFEAYTGGYIGTFLTYEEAELACLRKLIELVKK
jgi:hypothetical protein